MTEVTLTRAEPAPAPAAEAPHATAKRDGPASGGSLAGGLSQVVASQLVLVGTGLGLLPVLARNLGPQGYGAFSLYVTVLGIACNADLARPILIREYAAREGSRGDPRLAALASANAWLLALAAAIAGFFALGATCATALGLGAFLHARASRDFAELACAGRVARATSARNLAWALAALAVAGLSFAFQGPLVFALPFLAAHAALSWIYRAAALAISPRSTRAHPPLLPSPRYLLREVWPLHGRAIRDLASFSLSSGIVVSADRILLQRAAPAAVAGSYIAHSDLAIKLNAGGTALGALLYPQFARDVHERGRDAAALRFVRIAGWAACAWFALLFVLMLFDRQIVGLALGEPYLATRWVYVVTLVGIFVHLWGFLLTPWQRARGDFAAQRRAYGIAAVVMVATGLVLVPPLGLVGAVLAYFAARSAEVLLFARELHHVPRCALPRWKLATLAAMYVALISLAAFKVAGSV